MYLCRDISYLTYCWLCLTEVNQQCWISSQRSVLKSSRSLVRYGFESICRTNRQKPPLCLQLHGLHCVSIAFHGHGDLRDNAELFLQILHLYIHQCICCNFKRRFRSVHQQMGTVIRSQ